MCIGCHVLGEHKRHMFLAGCEVWGARLGYKYVRCYSGMRGDVWDIRWDAWFEKYTTSDENMRCQVKSMRHQVKSMRYKLLSEVSGEEKKHKENDY